MWTIYTNYTYYNLGAAIALGLLLAGCASRLTQAELEQDPRDSLTVQREQPKAYARPGTTVGEMRRDFRLCAAASPHMQKYSALHTPGADGWVSEGLLDVVTLGTHSTSVLKDGIAETRVCMKEKGYSAGE